MERKIIFANINENDVLDNGMKVGAYVEKMLLNISDESLKECCLNIGEICFTAILNENDEIEINKVDLI